MICRGDRVVCRVEHLHPRIVAALVDFDEVAVPDHEHQALFGRQGCPDGEWLADNGRRAQGALAGRRPGRGRSGGGQDRGGEGPRRPEVPVMTRLRLTVAGAYTAVMNGVDEQAAPVAMLPPQADVPAPLPDPVSHLAAVYRDYPGLRALILRRVHDPDVAADILQDAAVTTLEKLRNGEIAHPENVGGYLYRVALNHLRNHRRKDRTGVSSADAVDELQANEGDADWEQVGRPQWAAAARRMLDEMPAARDRELLLRFYLNDEEKEQICKDLHLSHEHFNRVIFRARNRFRELAERRGWWKTDLLTLVAIGLLLGQGTLAVSVRDEAADASPAAMSQAMESVTGDVQ